MLSAALQLHKHCQREPPETELHYRRMTQPCSGWSHCQVKANYLFLTTYMVNSKRKFKTKLQYFFPPTLLLFFSRYCKRAHNLNDSKKKSKPTDIAVGKWAKEVPCSHELEPKDFSPPCSLLLRFVTSLQLLFPGIQHYSVVYNTLPIGFFPFIKCF